MWNGTTLLVFYGLAAAVIVLMLVRLWRKRQRERHLDPREAGGDRWSLERVPLERPTAAANAIEGELNAPPVSILKPAARSTSPATIGGLDDGPGADWRDRERYVTGWSDRTPGDSPLPLVRADQVPTTRTDDFVLGPATRDFAALLPESERRNEEIRQEMYAAGYYEPHALANLSAVRYLAMIVPLVVFGVLLLLVPPAWEPWMIALVVIGPLLGWALPRLYVRAKAEERRREIERGMPDLLDMMNMCVSQGMTVPDSLRRVQRELRGAYPALAQELRIISEQAEISSLDVALRNFSRRIDIPETHSFTSLLVQTSRMGTSVSQALGEYSDTMRESLKQRAEEKGNRAAFRLLFPTVLCLMPAVYLFLMGPAVIELSRFFSAGGRDGLDRGSSLIERINNNSSRIRNPQL